MLVNGVIQHLLATTAVTDLVSDRVRRGRIEQGDPLPAVRVAGIGGAGDETLDGDDETASGRVQIDAYGGTSAVAATLAEACRRAIHGQRAQMGDVLVDGSHLTAGPRDLKEPARDGSDRPLCRVMIEFRVTYSRTLVT